MSAQWQIFHLPQLARYDELPLHAHEHEVFDVLQGQGTMYLDGTAMELKAGAAVFVPAGVQHGFKNTGPDRWLIRATIQQRTSARHAIRRAIAKRLGRARRCIRPDKQPCRV
jgi:mannose-6-phosphate isomerase-like protein (cupin superfamily)